MKLYYCAFNFFFFKYEGFHLFKLTTDTGYSEGKVTAAEMKRKSKEYGS